MGKGILVPGATPSQIETLTYCWGPSRLPRRSRFRARDQPAFLMGQRQIWHHDTGVTDGDTKDSLRALQGHSSSNILGCFASAVVLKEASLAFLLSSLLFFLCGWFMADRMEGQRPRRPTVWAAAPWDLWLSMAVPAAGGFQGCGSPQAPPDGHHTTNPGDHERIHSDWEINNS